MLGPSEGLGRTGQKKTAQHQKDAGVISEDHEHETPEGLSAEGITLAAATHVTARKKVSKYFSDMQVEVESSQKDLE